MEAKACWCIFTGKIYKRYNTSSYNNYADIIPQSYVPKSWKLEDLVSLMNYSEKVQNKCVVVIEDFKMVEEVIDEIGLPQALPKLFYDSLRNHRGWPPTPSRMTNIKF